MIKTLGIIFATVAVEVVAFFGYIFIFKSNELHASAQKVSQNEIVIDYVRIVQKNGGRVVVKYGSHGYPAETVARSPSLPPGSYRLLKIPYLTEKDTRSTNGFLFVPRRGETLYVTLAEIYPECPQGKIQDIPLHGNIFQQDLTRRITLL